MKKYQHIYTCDDGEDILGICEHGGSIIIATNKQVLLWDGKNVSPLSCEESVEGK